MCTSLTVLLVAVVLTACGTTHVSTPIKKPTPTSPTTPPKPGGYYQDDGPGPNPPANLDTILDATPRQEKFHSGANKPYTVFGRTYVPVVNHEPFRQSGVASWYGRKYHGNMTSIGEIYDMYAMTAAHPTLPLPSYVRVTNPANQKSVVVRVNDRGPFHSERIIDLSYAAAHRLDIVRRGSAPVVMERVFAGQAQMPTSTIAAPSAPAIATNPITTEGAALFLQLGAYSNQDSANIFRDRMMRELDWNREPLTVVFKDGLWRVRMGPYAARAEAEAIQARVRESHDFSPVISTQPTNNK
jgi:rare lipoprotein A